MKKEATNYANLGRKFRGRRPLLGDWGGTPPKKFGEPVLPGPCLQTTHSTTESKWKNRLKIRSTTNNLKLFRMGRTISKIKFPIPLILFTLFLLITSVSCSSLCNRTQKITTVLENQSKLVEAVKAYRSDQKVHELVKKDAVLARAEEQLMAALNAILHANKSIKRTLKPSNKEKSDGNK